MVQLTLYLLLSLMSLAPLTPHATMRCLMELKSVMMATMSTMMAALLTVKLNSVSHVRRPSLLVRHIATALKYVVMDLWLGQTFVMIEVFTVWTIVQAHNLVGPARCWVTNQPLLTATPLVEMESSHKTLESPRHVTMPTHVMVMGVPVTA